MKVNFTQIAALPTPIRIVLFVVALLGLWVPLALPIERLVSDRNQVSLLTMPLLYAEFIALVLLWGRLVYEHPNLLRRYGLRQPRKSIPNLLKGLGIGFISLVLMFAVQSVFGWVVWQLPQSPFPKIVIEGALVALGVGLAEELLFRGWLLDELQRGYSDRTAMVACSVIFAALHCIRPLHESIQFPALIILGMILVWAKRASQGRLGLSIGLHAGLVWGYYVVNVGQLVQYSNQVPDWVTGVARNPLAGVIGIVSLSAIAVWIRAAAHRDRRASLRSM